MDIAIDFIEPHGIKAVRNGLQTEKVKNNDDDLKLRKENKIKRKEQKKKNRKEKKRENSKRKNKDKQLGKNGKLDNTEIDVSLTTIKHSPDGNLSFLQSQNSGNNTISERPSANLPPKEFSDNVKNVKIKKNDGIHIISHEYVKNLIKKAFEAREKSPEAKLSKPIPLSIVTSTEPNKLRSTSMPTATTDSMTGTDNLKTNVPNEPQVSPIISEFTTKESNHPTAESTTTKETVTKSFSTLLPTSGKQTSKPIHISTTERTQQIIPEAGNEKKTEISSATKTPEVTTAKLSDDVAITIPNLTNIQSTEVEKHPEIITTNVTKKSTTTEKTTEMKTQPEIKTTNVTKQTTSFETATILPSSVTQLESFTNDTSSTFTAKNIDTNVPDDNKEIDKTESSNTKMDNIPKKAHSGSVVIQENKNSNSTKADDIDIIIFPSSRADKRRRKQERRRLCANIDFGDAKKGFQCCKKTLNCFDDLPENIDETVFHNGHHEYNEAERLHVCHHIDEALVCKDGVFNRSVCKNVNPIMEGKIKPQLDKVKLFYYNHCNRGTAITPTGGYPSHKPHPHVPPTGPGGTGSEQYHSHTNSYAPYIGGAIMGVFALVIIVLFAIYCRKRVNKRKRNKEQRNDPGRESTQSSRYKTVSYNRRKSDVYAEIDEKSMISSVSYNIDGHSCSTDVTNLSHSNTSSFSRKYQSAPSIRQLELDNHGYLSPESIMPEDELKSNIADENTSTHGYIELKSESGDSGQSYAKLEPEPEDEYIQADEIESTPIKKKKPDEQGHMYFVLEKENEESNKVPDQ
ncbi:uncharacterized protein LOC127719020 isoform X1 [Mytilus californianus]|uniref:uncharacterized protein LOC127719020 isoform X1 n=1 Tax=Mytilus californianus TaxID=6549 RepID=UPI00224518D7|nr:uncharacterized protein LOC127719020 isoform X1 [Mytilus californianus]